MSNSLRLRLSLSVLQNVLMHVAWMVTSVHVVCLVHLHRQVRVYNAPARSSRIAHVHETPTYLPVRGSLLVIAAHLRPLVYRYCIRQLKLYCHLIRNIIKELRIEHVSHLGEKYEPDIVVVVLHR